MVNFLPAEHVINVIVSMLNINMLTAWESSLHAIYVTVEFVLFYFVFCASCSSCQSMTSLYSATVSPVKDSSSSPLCRASSIGKPPLRALYDLLIAPMEGVCVYVSVMYFSVDCIFLFECFRLARSPGPDAQQWTCGQTQTARISAGGRVVPDPVCLAQRQLL